MAQWVIQISDGDLIATGINLARTSNHKPCLSNLSDKECLCSMYGAGHWCTILYLINYSMTVKALVFDFFCVYIRVYLSVCWK